MRKIILVITLCLLVLSISACGSKSKPEDPINNYLSAAQKLDTQVMAVSIVPSNTEHITGTKELISVEEDEIIKYFVEYLKTNASKMTFKVSGIETTGDKAVVSVDVKYIDGGPIFRDTFFDFMIKITSLAFSSELPTDDEINQMFQDALKSKIETTNDNFKEESLKIECVKVDGTWYISEIEDELVNVVMSGFITVGKEIEEAVGQSNILGN